MAFLCAFKVFQTSKSIETELFFEDSGDLFMHALIDQKGGFNPPFEFIELFKQLQEAQKNPLKEYKAVAKYRFSRYYDYVNVGGSLENAVLAYFVCLVILEDITALDKDEGLQRIKKLVESEDAAE